MSTQNKKFLFFSFCFCWISACVLIIADAVNEYKTGKVSFPAEKIRVAPHRGKNLDSLMILEEFYHHQFKK